MKYNKSVILKFTVIIVDLIFTACFIMLVTNGVKVNKKEFVLSILMLIICYIVSILSFVFDYHLQKKQKNEEASMLNNITLEFIQNLKLPVLISDEDGNTVWYNEIMGIALNNACDIEFGDNISNLSDGQLTVNDLLDKEQLDAKINGVHYNILPYTVNLYNKKHIISIFNDRTEVDKITADLKMKNPVVSFIVVDNLGDIYSNMQDKNREASNKISEILNVTANELHGLIKEYERDRYILIFEYHYLLKLTENKFDILDQVREATSSESSVPVTISIGIACDETDFTEKVETAKQALELAIQRGGDQAVVKYLQNTEIYGGKSKTVQRRSRLRSRVIVNELELAMKNSSNVIVMAHKNADNDAIGASIGIAKIANHCGTKVNIVYNPNDLNYKSIIKPISSKLEYRNCFIDSVQALEMLEANTLLVIVDVNNPSVMEEPQIFYNASKSAVIDHHRKNAETEIQSAISYIDPSVSSTCELISEMLDQYLSSGEIYKEEADIILSGIWLDTNQFSKNLGVRTIGAMQYLSSIGAKPERTAVMFKQTLDEIIAQTKFEKNIKMYFDHVAISVVSEDCSPCDKIAAAKAADRLIEAKDVSAAFVLYRTGDVINISARSSAKINVGLILEKLGGGGHYDMAGAQIKATDIKGVERNLLEKIYEYTIENAEEK